LLNEVDAVARAIVDPQFGHTVPDWLDIARVAKREASYPNIDSGLGDSIAQPCEPI
jgi:hypothetical protein